MEALENEFSSIIRGGGCGGLKPVLDGRSPSDGRSAFGRGRRCWVDCVEKRRRDLCIGCWVGLV